MPRNLVSRVLILPLLATVTVACGGSDAAETATAPIWEHTSTTEGNVTTVNNIAGSKWGGDARLVEELSIGELEGADEYAFGAISGIWPTDDRVYVSDTRLDVARAYDLDGNFLFTIGATGQGPGEYESAVGIVGLQGGGIALHDGQQLVIYDVDGNYVETWGDAENTGFRFMSPGMYAVSDTGDIYLRKLIIPEGGFQMGSMTFVMRQALPGGLGEVIELPSFDYETPTHQATMGGSSMMMYVPFAAETQVAMMPDGGFAAGVSLDYSFELRKPDGSVVVVEKYWDPVPVTDGELELRMSRQRVVMNGQTIDIDMSGVDIPETKPAYTGFLAARDGRLVVLPSAHIIVADECLDPNLTGDDIRSMDCTTGTSYADVFDADGAFLGSFEIPEGANLGRGAYLDGDTLWTSVQDDLGTVMVKRYRLVLPRDPSDSSPW